MKIGNEAQIGISPVGPAVKKTASHKVDKGEHPTQHVGEAFKVQLSSLAERAAAAPKEHDDIRWEKVAAIRSQLAAGTYNISGKDVANKILNALKE